MFNLSLKCHLYLSTCGRLLLLEVKSDTHGTGPPKAIHGDPQKVRGDGFAVRSLIVRDYHCHQLLFTISICIYNAFTSLIQNLLTQSIQRSQFKSTALSGCSPPTCKYWASTQGKQEWCLSLFITRHQICIESVRR
jgi:hypothetical protein